MSKPEVDGQEWGRSWLHVSVRMDRVERPSSSVATTVYLFRLEVRHQLPLFSRKMAASDSLQFAQIIADLQTLQNVDPNAAIALLSAHKTLSSTTRRRSRTSFPEPPKFDKLGRRIVAPKTPAGLSMVDSSGSLNGKGSTLNNGNGKTSGNSSGVGTPALSQEADEDMKRARTLIELFEMRGKFKQMGDTGLTRAKERVDAVVSKYAEKGLEERKKVARARHLGV